MSEGIPVWRQALKDEGHPLNRAAWMLFSKDFNSEYVVTALAEQKDAVIAFCNLLLDAHELYPSEALGGGNAPIHAVELLCAWRVEAAIPRLIQILEEEEWNTIIYGTTADTIAAFGTVLVEPLLEMGTRKTKDENQVAIAGTLADAAPGDPRTVDFIRKIFDSRKKDFEISYMAENVLRGDPEGGATWLEGRIRNRKYSKDVRKRMEKFIADAKAGNF